MEKDSKRIILRSKGIFGAIDHWPWKLKKGHLTSKGDHCWARTPKTHRNDWKTQKEPKSSKKTQKTPKKTFLMNHE